RVPNAKRGKLQDQIEEQTERLALLREQYNENSQIVQEAKKQLAALQAKFDRMDQFVEEKSYRNNTAVEEIQREIADLERDMNGFRRQKAWVQARLAVERSTKEETVNWESQLAALQRERDQSLNIYNSFADKDRDLSIRLASKADPNRVIERATQAVQVRPKRATNIMLSIALASCL